VGKTNESAQPQAIRLCVDLNVRVRFMLAVRKDAVGAATAHAIIEDAALFTTLPGILATPLNGLMSGAGFRRKNGRTVYRITNRKIDVLTVEQIGPALCKKWSVPSGAAAIEAACYLPFVPSFELAEYRCGPRSDFIPKSHLECQVRLGVRRHVNQREIKSDNFWFVGESAKSLQNVVYDMIHVIESEVLPFFSFVEDLDGFIEYLQNAEQKLGGPGIWNVGKLGSFRRLHHLGFTALEAEKWSLANSSFIECGDIFLRKKLNIAPNVMECLKMAADLAAKHKTLP
jgi:hypothetical protein